MPGILEFCLSSSEGEIYCIERTKFSRLPILATSTAVIPDLPLIQIVCLSRLSWVWARSRSFFGLLCCSLHNTETIIILQKPSLNNGISKWCSHWGVVVPKQVTYGPCFECLSLNIGHCSKIDEYASTTVTKNRFIQYYHTDRLDKNIFYITRFIQRRP